MLRLVKFKRLLQRSPAAAAVVVFAVLAAGCVEKAPPSSPAPEVKLDRGVAEPELEDSGGTAHPTAVRSGAGKSDRTVPPAPPGGQVGAGPRACPDPPRWSVPHCGDGAPPGARLYAKARFAWIYGKPEPGEWIGYLSLGDSVALRGGSEAAARVGSALPFDAGRCSAWYAIEPRGFVCTGSTATTDPQDPVVLALARVAPEAGSPWPHAYAESTGAPRYARIPSEAEPSGDSAPLLPEVSPRVRESRDWVARGSTVAYAGAFDAAGRTFLLTADHAFVPKDLVRPYPRSDFQGVELGRGVSLPIAFFRSEPRAKLQRGPDGGFVETGEMFAVQSWVSLTGAGITEGDQRYLETREKGIFVRSEDATVVRQSTPTPFAASALESPGARAWRRTWIEVSVLGGWLIAYEGESPVFATLISPGRGGVPVGDIDPVKTASTPVGTFRVDGKFLTATMVSSSDPDLVHADVPFVMNFHGPHALHAAYWHDAWGELKSGGCVNLSPIDAKRIFEWTEPALPPGWHGQRSTRDLGRATVVVVHR